MIRAKNNVNPNLATYLITLDNPTVLKEITKIKHIFQIEVQWDKYNKKQKITQCYKCQRFGHGRNNCHRMVVCMRCAKNHETKDCPTPNENHKCHNCGEGHMANDPKCSVYINFINNVSTRNNQKLKNDKPNVNINECKAYPKSASSYVTIVHQLTLLSQGLIPFANVINGRM